MRISQSFVNLWHHCILWIVTLTWRWSIAIACRTHPALRAALRPQGSTTRAYLCSPCLPFLLLPPSTSPLNFFFLLPPSMSLLPVDFLSKNLGGLSWVSIWPRKIQKVQVSSRKFCLWACPFFGSVSSVPVSLNPPAQVSQSGSVPSLFLWIHLHSSASLGQFCLCCSVSTCTFYASWIVRVQKISESVFKKCLIIFSPFRNFGMVEELMCECKTTCWF